MTSVIGRALGAEAKLDQYADGEAFVRSVVRGASIDALNLAFESRENLPTPAEIASPRAWRERMGL